MELQNYINSHPNYISEFKNIGFKINSFKKLKIISYPYNQKPKYNQNNLWQLYCRGAVINSDHKIISLPPIHSINTNDQNQEFDNQNIIYEHLIDGTMINLFYNNDEWIITTRSEIGGYNKWDNNKSFRQMFDDCSQLDYETLDKSMSYSFVMRHTENRNISPIHQNELFLVEVYDYKNNTIRKLSKSEYPDNIYSIDQSYENKEEFMKMYEGPVINYFIKGFIIKSNSLCYKWINPYFIEVKNLKINMNNHLLNYIELRRNGNLKKYLRYFPEHQHLFNNYKEKIHSLSNDLYTTYKNVFIHKTTNKNDIPYHLKPMIYQIHKNYLNTKNPTTWTDIKDYIHTIPSKKLTFSLNYC